MKVRDSGIPEENQWSEFFDVNRILAELQINSKVNDLVDIGCGYGTFTIPSASLIKENLYAFDIETEMIDVVRQKIITKHLENVILEQRDILTQTTGLAENSIDYVMLFNILHHESPGEFFTEAYRILRPKGKMGILHWHTDILTPRGPELKIGPKPDQILQFVDRQKFKIYKETVIIKPYHYGLIISKQ
jgi:ubiquinone/menaquinone biosynthesis C-methylase UbiE